MDDHLQQEAMSPAVILGEGINALAIIRSLGRKNIPLYLFNSREIDIASRSKYVIDKYNAASASQDLLQQLIGFAHVLRQKPALFFTSDYFLRFVSRFEAELSRYYLIQIADKQVIELVSNKIQFSIFTEDNNLPAPIGLSPDSAEQLQEQIEKLRFPVIVKPSKSYDWRQPAFIQQFGKQKVMTIQSKDELIKIWPELDRLSDKLLIQEVIVGDDKNHFSYCAYRSKMQQQVAGLCVNKIRVNPVHAGAGSYLKTSEQPEMAKIAKKLLELLQFEGVASVCFKVDERTGQPMIHEVNGRLPQWHLVFQAYGIDLPWMMYQNMLGLPIVNDITNKNPSTWLSLDMDLYAFLGYRKLGELSFLQWLKSLISVNSCAEFNWRDWGPFIYRVKSILRDLLLKK